MTKQLATKSYNFRLDPRVPDEKLVIDALDQWRARNWTIRQIIKELVLTHQGIQLTEPQSDHMTAKAVRRVEYLLSTEILDLLKEIRNGNPAMLQSFIQNSLPQADLSQNTEPIDDEMLDAIQRAKRGKSMKRSDLNTGDAN